MNKEELIRIIDKNRDELIEVCSNLLKIPSASDIQDTTEITNYIKKYLENSGIEVKIYEPKPKLFNIVAHIGSYEGKQLIFCGHDDTVPVGDTSKWKFSPFSGEIVDGFLQGRGASDMEGGLAGILVAFVLIKRNNIKLEGGITLAIVPDEESGGKNGVPWILDKGIIHGDGCVIAEPSGIFNPTIGQKGSSWFKLTVYGTPGHGSLAPFLGDNAIINAIDAISRIRTVTNMKITVPEEVKDLVDISKKYVLDRENPNVVNVFEKITCNIGTIQGGTSSNVVADKCEVKIDLRLPFGITYEEVMSYIRKELDDLGIRYDIEHFGFVGSANFTASDNKICKAIVENIKYVTHENEKTYGVLQWACSDARHFRKHKIPVLQYGPAELNTIHGFNEKVKVEDVIICAKTYLLAASDFLS